MRKAVLVLLAMLVIAASAFGQVSNPTTTDNDDSCEITVAPAATLLLPIFDVDLTAAAGAGQTTLFTITNTTNSPQIAHVTVWTDWSFPILDFNIFLTGYDVQSVNLYDVLVRNLVAPNGPGTSSTSTSISPRAPQGSVGAFSAPLANTANPNILTSAVTAGGPCSGTNLPGTLPTDLMDAVREALTTGLYNPANAPGIGCDDVPVGGEHDNARGYITIDVANTCSINLPDNPTYITTELLFDNVLIGDYQQINGSTTVGNFAQGNPMVHIRAIPEGGPAGSNPGTNLPYTFYDRYAGGRFDRRVPLPSTFAARWIEGGSSGFQTNYKIWREGLTFGTQTCFDAEINGFMPFLEAIRFDERENSFGTTGGIVCSPCPSSVPTLPEASIVSTADNSIFPANGSAVDVSGWFFLNMNNGGDSSYTSVPGDAPAGSNTINRASQNWVIVSMFAQGRFSVDFDAAHLGNGCSAARVISSEIGPAGGIFVCPQFLVCVAGAGQHPYSGTNVTP